MCSLVEIKNHDEIYIHYIYDDNEDHDKQCKDNAAENTSDRGDSIDSVDNNGDVGVTTDTVTNADIAVQVDMVGENKDEKRIKKHNKATLTMGNNFVIIALSSAVMNCWCQNNKTCCGW